MIDENAAKFPKTLDEVYQDDPSDPRVLSAELRFIAHRTGEVLRPQNIIFMKLRGLLGRSQAS